MPRPPSHNGSSRADAAQDKVMAAIANAKRAVISTSTARQPHLGIVADVERAPAQCAQRAAQVGDREDVVHDAEGVEALADTGGAEEVPCEHRDDGLLH